jgi:hypothetical protein
MDLGIQFARSQVMAIASDRVAHIAPDNKAALLALVDLTLDQWKNEQIQPDGMIVIERSLIGLLGDWPLNVELGDIPLTDPPTPRRVRANKLLPEQCAGPFVRCKADLFTKLWGDKYALVQQITTQPGAGLDIVLALLVERDGEMMTAGSLASALRYVWITTWDTAKFFKKLLVEQDAAQVATVEQFAKTRSEGVASRVRASEQRREDALVRCERMRKDNPTLKRFAVADNIRAEWIREASPGAFVPEVSTIEDYLKGAFR